MSVREFKKMFAAANAVAFLKQVRASLQQEAAGLPENHFYTGI
jgi:hypothetical protein